MSLESYINDVIRDIAETAIREAFAKHGRIEVVQGFDPYHRFDAEGLKARLGVDARTIGDEIPSHTDDFDGWNRRYWLEMDIRAYLDKRRAIGITRSDQKPVRASQNADADIAEQLGMLTS